MLQTLAERHESLMITMIIIYFTGTGLVLVWIFTSARCRPSLLSYDGVVGPFFGLPAVLFSLMTALNAASLWDNYAAATQAVRAESQSLIAIISLAESIPDLRSSGLADLARSYARSVIEDEWETLSPGTEQSPITRRRYEELRSALFGAINHLGNSAEARTLQTELLHTSAARDRRLAHISFDVHITRWYALVALALLVQAAVAFVHIPRPRALKAAMCIATLTILVPLCSMAVTVSTPYQGMVAISSTPFLTVLR
jgi:hypothetical protein